MAIKKGDSIAWKIEMSVGVDVIDNDHKKLLNLINEMDYIIQADVASKKGAIESVISELIDYTIYHFDREEKLMEVCSYPELERHKRVHESLKLQVQSYMDSYQRKPQLFEPKAMRIFLNLWLVDHIMSMDKDYESWMQGKTEIIENTNAAFENLTD
jgi:hemerythrin